jgi:cytoskeletal protein RodZ
MYTEGYEGLEEAEKGSRRAYVSHISQDESESLMREIEQLKTLLEKEKFFNKLLDQELQELKSGQGQSTPVYSSYWQGQGKVKKGKFYLLLIVVLAMAAFICWGIFYHKSFRFWEEKNAAPALSNTQQITPSTAAENNSTTGKAQTPTTTNGNNNVAASNTAAVTPPVVKDSVPNIIATKKPAIKEKVVVAEEDPIDENNEDAVEQDTKKPIATDVDTRAVIARYRVTSKANFYNAPDENTLRNTFISQSADKVVGALEEKNDFIFVVYTNDLGYTSRGWLSKKDLTKVE